MSVGRITLPLLAALPWNLDPPRHGAVGAGQPHVHGAERHAAHGSVQAGTLVLAAALESLSALVHGASEHTGGSVSSCEGGGGGQDSACSQGRVTRRIKWQQLTCANAYTPVDAGPEVAVEALVRVAHVSLGAQLPHLLGAHPAAAAAVQDQADSWGALGGSGGARALFAALLSRRLSPTGRQRLDKRTPQVVTFHLNLFNHQGRNGKLSGFLTRYESRAHRNVRTIIFSIFSSFTEIICSFSLSVEKIFP